MSRLTAVMSGDVRLQVRNGFYYAAALLAMFGIVALNFFDRDVLAWLLPPLVLSNLLTNTFYFIAGLVLLEKAEGTLEAQVVTPLRTAEYLGSKVATLTALAVVENLAIVSLTYGLGARPLPLVAGMITASAIYALFGFVAVARYDSINEYLLPSFVYTMAFGPPLVAYFGYWDGWWIYLHPLQAALVLLEGAFRPLAAWEWVYGVMYPAVWIAIGFQLSRRSFHRFVIASAGAH
jgi:fluoroquinolone transport system permease protein